MERIGLLGGTFDPPHLGHLILAEIAVDSLALDEVWFVLAADPPHKRDCVITPVSIRLAMLNLAIADNPRFHVSRIDIDRPGPHYTVDMLRIAVDQRPGVAWVFLMGSDSLRDLPTWREPERILELCTLGVLRRPGVTLNAEHVATRYPSLSDRMVMLEGPAVDLSASDIGRRLSTGRSIRYMVPDAVREFIEEHQLYRS
jgi:nicotinate-nucleotide adenylyltransferase